MNHSLDDIDSIIFDMDGTLWNATESYAKIWNATCNSFGVEAAFSGGDLVHYMGMSLEQIMMNLLGDELPVSNDVFLTRLGEYENMMMPSLGGVLYPGVKECLEKLHGKFRLFMLSNCSPRGLRNFVNFTGTAHLFEGLLTQGERPVEKCDNLLYMVSEYSLKHPTYVGDTQADCDQCHAASLPFTYATWGFGNCINPEWKFSTIEDMTTSFLNTKSLR